MQRFGKPRHPGDATAHRAARGQRLAGCALTSARAPRGARSAGAPASPAVRRGGSVLHPGDQARSPAASRATLTSAEASRAARSGCRSPLPHRPGTSASASHIRSIRRACRNHPRQSGAHDQHPRHVVARPLMRPLVRDRDHRVPGRQRPARGRSNQDARAEDPGEGDARSHRDLDQPRPVYPPPPGDARTMPAARSCGGSPAPTGTWAEA